MVPTPKAILRARPGRAPFQPAALRPGFGSGGLAKNISRESKICWLWNRELGGSQKH
jgi:hypothetical protein